MDYPDRKPSAMSPPNLSLEPPAALFPFFVGWRLAASALDRCSVFGGRGSAIRSAPRRVFALVLALLACLGILGCTPSASLDSARLPSAPTYCWRKGAAIYRDRNHDGRIDWEVSGESWRHDGLDTYKVDANFDAYYDVKYTAGGIKGAVYWTTNLHERGC